MSDEGAVRAALHRLTWHRLAQVGDQLVGLEADLRELGDQAAAAEVHAAWEAVLRGRAAVVTHWRAEANEAAP
jgi:hypothetical protein